MFRLGISPKEIFLAYSTQFVFSIIWLVPGNVIMVAIDMCGESPIMGEWIYGITWKHAYFNIFVLFIVDTTSILKLVFPTVYCFCLDGYFGGCVVAIIVTVVVVIFIYLFCFFVFLIIILFVIFSAASTVILIFVVVVVIATVAFVVGVIVAFCVYLVIVVTNLMLMF